MHFTSIIDALQLFLVVTSRNRKNLNIYQSILCVCGMKIKIFKNAHTLTCQDEHFIPKLHKLLQKYAQYCLILLWRKSLN